MNLTLDLQIEGPDGLMLVYCGLGLTKPEEQWVQFKDILQEGLREAIQLIVTIKNTLNGAYLSNTSFFP